MLKSERKTGEYLKDYTSLTKEAVEHYEKATNSIEIAIKVLQSELDRLENKALTFSELKELRHSPVWVKSGCFEPFCMIISKVDKYYVRGVKPNTHQNSIQFMIDNDLPTFYKHKPRMEDKV